jgi:heat shock protein HslJ
VADLLSSGPTVEPQAQGLVLRTGATVVGFVDRSVVEPDRDLVGTRWELTGFVRGGGPDGVASDAGGLEAEVTFQEDGTATGFDGCRAFGMGQGDGSPGYVVEGDTISYSGGIDADGAACPDLAEQVEDVRAVLTGTVVWEVDGDRLTLRTSDGSGATFRAAGG